MLSPALRTASRLRPGARLVTTLPLVPKKRNLYFCGPKASNRGRGHDHDPSKPTPKHYIAGPHSYSEHSASCSSDAAYADTAQRTDQATTTTSNAKGLGVDESIVHLESIWKRGNVKVTEETNV